MVLIGVDADAETARVRRRLEHAESGAAGSLKDHLGTPVELGLRQLSALDGVVPGRARRPRHVLKHPYVGVGMARAQHVTTGEPADQRNVHAAHESDLAALGRHRGQDTDDEGAFMLPEDNRLHVGLVDDRVDDGEAGLGELGRDLLQGGGVLEAHCQDGVLAPAGEVAQRLHALGVVLHLELPELDSGVGRKLRGAVVHALVEGLVELAAQVIHDTRLDVGRGGGATGQERRDRGEEETFQGHDHFAARSSSNAHRVMSPRDHLSTSTRRHTWVSFLVQWWTRTETWWTPGAFPDATERARAKYDKTRGCEVSRRRLETAPAHHRLTLTPTSDSNPGP